MNDKYLMWKVWITERL